MSYRCTEWSELGGVKTLSVEMVEVTAIKGNTIRLYDALLQWLETRRLDEQEEASPDHADSYKGLV